MHDQQRLAEISDRLLAEIRAAITDLRITEDEIHHAAEFFNALGQAGEFADMLDIFFGVTSVVATLGAEGGTTPNLSGPYYKAGAPVREDGRLYDGELPAKEIPLTVHGRVTDVLTGEPVTDAILDLWQADGEGIYDEGGDHLRGLIPVDANGEYEFHTAFPEGYQIPAKGPTTELLEAIGQHNWRPAHIHLRVHVGDTTPLQTQFFMAGVKYLDSDPVDAVRDDLILQYEDAADGHGRVLEFNIGLALDDSAARRSHLEGPKAKAAAR
jgi:protocatechuate 3,4-dioxygenase beta subunit